MKRIIRLIVCVAVCLAPVFAYAGAKRTDLPSCLKPAPVVPPPPRPQPPETPIRVIVYVPGFEWPKEFKFFMP